MTHRFILSDDPTTETERKRKELAAFYKQQEADVVRNLILVAYENMQAGQVDTVSIPVIGKVENGVCHFDGHMMTDRKYGIYSEKSGPAFAEVEYAGTDTERE